MTDESSVKPRVLWTSSNEDYTKCRVTIKGAEGRPLLEEYHGLDGMEQENWGPVATNRFGLSYLFFDILCDYLALQAAAPDPPSSLAAFVAENPGFTADGLLRRTPPTHKTWTELHDALCADPQISWQKAGKDQGTCGWYAVYGKPEAKADPVKQEPHADALLDLVRKHRDATAEELWDLDHRSMGEFIKQLRAHPGIHVTEPDREIPTYRLAEPAP